MRTLKIGIVDLDASHPGNWVPIIKELGFACILWSDPQVYASWGNERGNDFMNDITRHALSAIQSLLLEPPLDILDGR